MITSYPDIYKMGLGHHSNRGGPGLQISGGTYNNLDCHNKQGTYLVQTKDLVQTHANLPKKVSKNFEKKIMNMLLSLPHLYIKFHDKIHLTLKITKKTNFLTTVMVQMHLKFVLFVTSRVR